MSNVNPLDERTDEQPKSAYITKRDVKMFFIVVGVLAILLLPVYFVMRRSTDRYLCLQNMESISKAIALYAEANDERLPPVSDRNGAPSFHDGQLTCWATISSLRGGMKAGTSLVCPSAQADEAVQVAAANHTTEPLTYGMYIPLGGMSISSIENTGQTLMIGETSNNGAQKTYDPIKFKDASGNEIKSDAFAIGWDTSNVFPEPTTRYATRLAFYNTDHGDFHADGACRHDGGDYFLNVDGARRFLDASTARVYMDSASGRPKGWWSVPFAYGPHRTP